MSYWTQAFSQAWHMIIDGDPYLMHVIRITLEVAAVPTGIAALLGIPLGVVLGVGRFRGRGIGLALANAGLGLPPVVVGLVFVMLTLPVNGPLARFHLLFTLEGVFVVQTVLALPVIVALTASSIGAVSTGLLDQARAFGAGRVQVAGLAIREARVGIVAALIAAVGGTLSEVGAVVLAGGNIQGLDQTLASAALQQVEAGRFVTGLAIGLVLLGLLLIISAALTVLQHRGAPGRRRRRSRLA
ncbi:ABC transporter permease [uncultured Jatrophihabitans sp.]|uniref:ABC transporter permease n=1 Tax=uncultured Jatrophihabitans sp. TaxID=1610747 RepID=UPI0035CC69A2